MSKQPVKYWETTIDATKSASEIMHLIVKYGGERTSIDWEGGQPVGISFIIKDADLGSVPVRLQARTDNVFRLLQRKVKWSGRGSRADHEANLRARAQRIVWRHLKDLIEQQLLAVEIGQYGITDVFMSGLVIVDRSGQESTMGQLVRSHADQVGLLRLPSGP